MPLALRQRGDDDADAAQRIDRDRGRRLGAVLRTCDTPLAGGQHRADVTHVGDRRLYHRGIADAVETAFGPRPFAPAPQLVEPALLDRDVEGALIIAGIQSGTGSAAIGEGVGRHQVAADDLQRIKPELDGHFAHQSFEREIDLWAAEAAIEAGRRLVGQHHPIADREVPDGIGSGHVAVHTIERRRLGRPQIGAAILELIPAQCGDGAVSADRRLDRRYAIGRGIRRHQMFEAILDPFDRSAGDARRYCHQDDVGKDRLLDPETAAAVGRRAQT